MNNKFQLLPINSEFPLPAANLKLTKYLAPNTLGNAEKEEAAVRLLSFSHQEGVYVGVPWNEVAAKWFAEAKEFAAKNEAHSLKYEQFQEEMKSYYKQRKDYLKLAWWTIGLSLLFVKHPTMPVFQVSNVPQPKTHSVTLELSFGDPNALIDAFLHLIEEGLIYSETIADLDYFFPTPTLVRKICGIHI